jgi:hypothetical protein
MQSFHFSLEYSAWWFVVIVLVSGSLAWLLYSGKNLWDKRMCFVLGSFRFVVLFLVLFLLLKPKLTSVKSFKEKPVFPIVVDNSESITMAFKNQQEIKSTIQAIQNKLQTLGFESDIVTFDRTIQSADSFSFDQTSSNISKLLSETEKSSVSKKPEGMLLLSDGIYNSGISPNYLTFRSKITVLGLGDTIPRKDIALLSLQNNSVAFLGNKFKINAEIQAIGYSGTEIEILLKDSKTIIERQRIKINDKYWTNKVDFIIPATIKGFQKYTIEIVPLKDESNLLNNKLNAYIDIVDDRENILLVAKAPHPNIKAIRSALDTKENIHFEVLIPGLYEAKSASYDLIIFQNCLLNDVPEASKYINDKSSIFYIAGSGTDFARFNVENGLIDIASKNEIDQIQGTPNSLFSAFKLNENTETVLAKLPPVEVPFGELKSKNGIEVALFQKINAIQSSKPLLIFGQSNRKTGVLLTDGLWQWRMYEAQESGKSEVVDELITKTVQYLSSKKDKRKFRIYPHQREYEEGEMPKIESELYNDLYEKIFGQKTSLILSNIGSKTKVFEFTPIEGNSALSLPALPSGVYKIEAKTNYSGKVLNASTEFIIKERQLEALDLRANHTLLRELVSKNKGEFYAWQNRDQLLKSLDNLKATPIWKSEEQTRNLIEEKWYYFLIVAFICTEWIIRRYTGGY